MKNENNADPLGIRSEATKIMRNILSEMNLSFSGTKRLSSRSAALFFDDARRLLETWLLNHCGRHSKSAWLWYLRRAPDEFFLADEENLFVYRASLAEILSSFGGRDETIHNLSGLPVVFPYSGEVTNDLLNLCSGAVALKWIHSCIRMSHKGVEFDFSMYPKRVIPLMTDSQRACINLHDARNASSPPTFFMKKTGTYIKTEVMPGDEYFILVSRAFRKDINIEPNTMGNPHAIQIKAGFDIVQISVEEISSLFFSSGGDFVHWQDDVAPLLMLGFALRYMLEAQPSYIASLLQFGYLLDKPDAFIGRVDLNFDLLLKVTKRVAPNCQYPKNASDLLHQLRNYSGKLWPMKEGSIIRDECKNELMWIDISTLTYCINDRLASFNGDGAQAVNKGRHFESMVQKAIDGTEWGNLTRDIRALISRRYLKKLNGDKLSDVDAVAASGDTLILVDCYSKIYSDLIMVGDYDTYRVHAESVEKKARKWREVIDYLRKNPKGRNYDLTFFRSIVGVVCTPFVVYIEEGLLANTKQFSSDFVSCVYEEQLPNLRAVCTFTELKSWLLEHAPSN